MKGGVGCAVERMGTLSVAALAVVNAMGDGRDARGEIIAGARTPDGGFADSRRLGALQGGGPRGGGPLRNTTIAVVATSAPISRVALSAMAKAASAALYRRITPSGKSVDGDVVFALAPLTGAPAPASQVEALAVEALERAIERGLRLARGRDGIPGLADGELR
ncbi:MAG: hypothetical protein NVS1B4_00450 [Gemmatimonadaceae bacterium]